MSDKTGIVILGVNGNCIDIAEVVELLAGCGEALKVLGFVDDNPALQGQRVAGYPVLGKIADAPKFADARFVNGIGSTRSFRRKPDIIASAGIPLERWATLVHPAAFLSPRATLGRGTVLLANASVCTNARVGNHVLVLPGAVVSHDAVVGDFTGIASGACISGVCQIGLNCYLGSNCVIREGLSVGDRALIGMGAVVTANVAADTVVAGNPARLFQKPSP
jgi:sugar O-acyltransferase (sialic acid O-acetyltransferase NeuD family)